MSDRPATAPKPPRRSRDVAVAAACGAFVALMVGASYAAVPLYDWLCRVTGMNGATQVATSAPSQTLDRVMTVRFDGNVAPGLPWRFVPEKNEIEVRVGEVVTVHYTVINLSARATTGQATYNVAPLSSGVFFQKINCFCFTEQTLAPGEKREMAVVFYVDPAIADDSDHDQVRNIVLSYTFHSVREPSPRPQAARTDGKGAGRL